MWSLQSTSFGMLDMWAGVNDVQTAQYWHDKLGSTLVSACFTTGECVAHCITSLFQKGNITT